MKSILSVLLAAVGLPIGSVFASSGSHNLLLVVNPADESALRVAHAYVEARDIPERNVLYITPPDDNFGQMRIDVGESEWNSIFQQPILQAISDRGLSGQINFIGFVGQPTDVRATVDGAQYVVAIPNAAAMMPIWPEGVSVEDADGHRSGAVALTGIFAPFGAGIPGVPYTPGMSAAITSETDYPVFRPAELPAGLAATRYFVGGNVAWTGQYGGATADQLIAALRRSAAADGTHPDGTVYFWRSNDIRTEVREPSWPEVQTAMTANGYPWIQEDVIEIAPNRTDVLGAVMGYDKAEFPLTTSFVPGAYADNVTSGGANYRNNIQSRGQEFLTHGAAGSAGSVQEPFAVQQRFTNSSIHLLVRDGITLGEAFFKTVVQPDYIHFIGDLLAKPFADLPQITLTGAPAEGASVSGTVGFSASAALVSPVHATGIHELSLLIDGVEVETAAGASASFSVDTTLLSDGLHELRIVAVNNAPARSPSALTRLVRVNNTGRFVSAAPATATVSAHGSTTVTVTTAGGGTVTTTELRRDGLTLVSSPGVVPSLALDAALLVYGENRIVPVLVYGDGSEVRGAAFEVERERPFLTPLATTPEPDRFYGWRFEYWNGRGARTIDATDFSSAPDEERIFQQLNNGSPDNPKPSTISNNFALRISARFVAETAGEYGFSIEDLGLDALRVLVNGQTVHDFASGGNVRVSGVGNNSLRTFWLEAGEHEIVLLASEMIGSQNLTNFHIRKADGLSITGIDNSTNRQAYFFVTGVTIEEPEAPSNLLAQQGPNGGLLITWDGDATHAAAYRFEYRRNGSSTWVTAPDVSVSGNRYELFRPEFEQWDRYEVRLRAVNSIFTSAYSNIYNYAWLYQPVGEPNPFFIPEPAARDFDPYPAGPATGANSWTGAVPNPDGPQDWFAVTGSGTTNWNSNRLPGGTNIAIGTSAEILASGSRELLLSGVRSGAPLLDLTLTDFIRLRTTGTNRLAESTGSIQTFNLLEDAVWEQASVIEMARSGAATWNLRDRAAFRLSEVGARIDLASQGSGSVVINLYDDAVLDTRRRQGTGNDVNDGNDEGDWEINLHGGSFIARNGNLPVASTSATGRGIIRIFGTAPKRVEFGNFLNLGAHRTLEFHLGANGVTPVHGGTYTTIARSTINLRALPGFNIQPGDTIDLIYSESIPHTVNGSPIIFWDDQTGAAFTWEIVQQGRVKVLRITATQAVGTPLSPYETWLDSFGLDTDATGNRAPGASFAGDDVPNLLKRGLGLDPRVRTRLADHVTSLLEQNPADGLALTLRLTRPRFNPVTIGAAVSDDLVEWLRGSTHVEVETIDHGDGTETVIFRDRTTTGERRFMRLELSE